MNINRDNYEEYFLLYTDNELTVQEKTAVEEFVLQNPDLKEELEMLQGSVLIPDHIIFENKGSLLNNEFSGSGLQEKLLLLLDDELTKSDSIALKSVIENDIEIAKEWELLRSTKLSSAENIIFTDKAILYQKEKVRLIPMGWRIAAAAVLIGFGLWGAITYTNRAGNAAVEGGLATKPKEPGLLQEPVTRQAGQIATNDSGTITSSAKSAETANNLVNSAPAEKQKKDNTAQKGNNKIVKSTNDDLVSKDPASTVKKPSNNLPVPLEKINNKDGNNIEVASVPSLKKSDVKELVNPGVEEAAQPYVINTAFADNKDEKITYGFDDEEDQPKKTKAGGFFKKLNRVLQRKANIKTGNSNSFKVANLSFAVQ